MAPSSKKKFQRYDPEQTLLIAPDLREWLPKDHLCYFVADVVAGLDLSAMYAEYDELRGAPPYDPQMMTAVLIYAYCIGETSSRRIFKALQENVAFRVLAAGNRPDHRTVCRFRVQHAEALRGLFRRVPEMCRKEGLVPAEAVAPDGTKVKANASMAKNRTKEQPDKELREYAEKVFAEAERKDREEDEKYGEDNDGFSLPPHLADPKTRREHIKEGLLQMREEERKAEERRKRAEEERAERVCEGLCQIKEEEEKDKAEEARKEAERQEKEREAAVEGKKVRGRKPAGKEEKPLRRNTTDPGSRTMKTQNGYVQGYNVQIAVDRSGRVIVACDVVQDGNDKLQLRRMLAQIGESLGRPPGKLLADAGYFSAEAVEGVKGTELFVATKNRRKFGEGPVIEPGRPPTVKQAMELKLCTDEGRAIYKQRGCTVEPVNGQLKDRGGMREFRLRGTERTRTEAMLSCIGNNIKKLWKRPKDGPGRGCERPAGPVSGRSPAAPA